MLDNGGTHIRKRCRDSQSHNCTSRCPANEHQTSCSRQTAHGGSLAAGAVSAADVAGRARAGQARRSAIISRRARVAIDSSCSAGRVACVADARAARARVASAVLRNTSEIAAVIISAHSAASAGDVAGRAARIVVIVRCAAAAIRRWSRAELEALGARSQQKREPSSSALCSSCTGCQHRCCMCRAAGNW